MVYLHYGNASGKRHTAGSGRCAPGQGIERVQPASRWVVERVAGGANNAVYRVTGDGQQIACKLCVPDNRQRATRRFGVMQLLRSAGADVAPEPLWLDESCTLAPFPVVIYRWLAGEPLAYGNHPRSVDRLCRHRPADTRPATGQPRSTSGCPTAGVSWFDVETYLAELEDMLRQYGPWLVGELAGWCQPARLPGSHRRSLQQLPSVPAVLAWQRIGFP